MLRKVAEGLFRGQFRKADALGRAGDHGKVTVRHRADLTALDADRPEVPGPVGGHNAI